MLRLGFSQNLQDFLRSKRIGVELFVNQCLSLRQSKRGFDCPQGVCVWQCLHQPLRPRWTLFPTTSGAIDWASGNSGSTSYDCSGNMTFANLRDGGSYTIVVTSTGTAQCNFSTTTTGDDAATVSYRFHPTNSTRTASSHTVYSLQRIGTTVYVSWITGF